MHTDMTTFHINSFAFVSSFRSQYLNLFTLHMAGRN